MNAVVKAHSCTSVHCEGVCMVGVGGSCAVSRVIGEDVSQEIKLELGPERLVGAHWVDSERGTSK